MSRRGSSSSSSSSTKGSSLRQKSSQSTAVGLGITMGYLTLWGVILYFVYRYFRKPKVTEEGYFGANKERAAYLDAVKQLDRLGDVDEGSAEYKEKLEQCRKALVRRAMTCVRRLWKLHTDKDSVYALMRAGSIDEHVWQQFKAAEQHLQVEIYDVQAEAETFREGWCANVLREASDLCRKEDHLNELLKANTRKTPPTSAATSPVLTSGSTIEEISDEDD